MLVVGYLLSRLRLLGVSPGWAVAIAAVLRGSGPRLRRVSSRKYRTGHLDILLSPQPGLNGQRRVVGAAPSVNARHAGFARKAGP